MKFTVRSISFYLGFIATLSIGQLKAESTVYTSVKSMGMAGAVAAHPLDSLVGAYNPGALGFAGDRWDLGGHWARQQGRTRFTDNDFVSGSYDSHHTKDIYIPEFGINAYTCKCLFTWGFIIYNRTYFKTDYDRAISIYGTSKLGLEYIHAVAAPTFSLIIAENHCLGITIDLHGQRLKVNGLEEFKEHFFSRFPSKVTNKGYDYAGGYGGTIGWMSRVADCVSIGGAWSPRVKMSHFNSYKGLVAHKGRVDIPQRVVGGVAIQMLPGLTVAFDAEHVQFNTIRPIHNKEHLFRHPHHRHHHGDHHHHDSDHHHHHSDSDHHHHHSDSGHHHHHSDHHHHRDEEGHDHHRHHHHHNPFELGEKNGSGLGWMDQTTFRLGLDWDVSTLLSIRLGYQYHRDPVKNSQTFANALIPFISERIATFGGSWHWDRCNEVSFYGAYIFKHIEDGKDSIPTKLGGGNASLKEEKWVAGLAWARFF